MDNRNIISPHTASLKSLNVFCSAARTLSFKGASEELFITPSAVSHQIRSLEKRLQRDLFVREVRSVVLTDFGQQLFERVDPLIVQIYEQLNNLSSSETRVLLKIVLPPFLSYEIIIPRLNEFTNKHPEIDIHLDTQVVRPDVHPKSADLSILLRKKRPKILNNKKLFPLTLIPVCAPSYKLNIRQTAPFANKTLIIHHQRPTAWKKWLAETEFRHKTPPKTLMLESMAAVVKSAEEGLGCALAPKHLVGKWLESGALVQPHPRELLTEDHYYLTWDAKNKKANEIQIFIDWVITIFQ